MELAIAYYSIYFIISVSFTVWVGRNLFANGRTFLLDSFNNDAEKADSVNNLLLVGFYLVNFGLVMLFLSIGSKPTDIVGIFEGLAFKLGVVLVVLGGMHFFNMRNIGNMRSKALKKENKVF